MLKVFTLMESYQTFSNTNFSNKDWYPPERYLYIKPSEVDALMEVKGNQFNFNLNLWKYRYTAFYEHLWYDIYPVIE